MIDSPNNLRRRHYVDYQIQRGMIICLIVLEVALLFWALLFLYQGFSQSVTDQLYQVHGNISRNDESIFLHLVLRILVGLLFANIVALIVADFVWDQYIRWILRDFHTALKSIATLNFRHRPSSEGSHKVIDLLDKWRSREQTIWQEVKRLTERIEAAQESNLDVTQVKLQVKTLNKYLEYRRR